MERKSIGSFIAALRKANGLTQKQLAEKLNVSDKAISRWERDECAPDLSLIPVIAEIFDVTADELLCGERKTETEAVQKPRRTEKQKQRILNQSISKLRLQSLGALGISIFAIVAIIVLEAIFENHYITMLAILIIVAASVVCEIIFLSNAIHSVDDDEFDDEKISESKITVINFSKLIFGVNFAILYIYIALLFFLPFCSGIDSNSTYEMLSEISPTSPHNIFSPDIVFIELVFAGVGILIFRAIWNIALWRLSKKDVYSISESNCELQKFKKRFSIISVAVVLISSFVCMEIYNSNASLMFNEDEATIIFDNVEDFKKYAADNKSDMDLSLQGLAVNYVSPTNTYLPFDDDDESSYTDQILTYDGKVLLEYTHRNRDIYSVNFSNDTIPPIEVYTFSGYYQCLAKWRAVLLSIIALEQIFAFVLYPILLRTKRKKHL